MKAFRKILFPTDFSPKANLAFSHAIQIADLSDAEIVVQHVVRDYFQEHSHWATLFDVHELQTCMDGYIEDDLGGLLPKDSGKLRIRSLISKGDPAEEIVAASNVEKADLIVMGSAAGTVTGNVIRMSRRPVVAVSAPMANISEKGLHKPKKILVATDFSNHSRRVIDYAFDLKRIFNAAICLLYVIEPRDAFRWSIQQGHWTHGADKMKEWAGNQLLNLTPDEFLYDPTVMRRVVAGSADQTIPAIARQMGADLTILGIHEQGLVQGLFGTKASRLLPKVETPILTVRI